MFIPLTPFSLDDIFLEKKPTHFSGASWMSRINDRCILFSRGQWAFKELASAVVKKKNLEKGRIFIPEYFCEMSLTTIRRDEFQICFYRINEGLEPDISDLEKRVAKEGPPDVLLFVHYFGIPINMGPTKTWCRENDVVLVEDAAHSLMPVPGIGDHGCPVIYTPWKFFNLPDGTLLVIADDSYNLHPAVEECRDPYSVSWFLKRLTLAIAQAVRFPIHRIRKYHVKASDESEPPIDPGKPYCRSRSVSIISKKERDLLSIGEAREKNYRQIDDAIKDSGMHIYRMFKDLPSNFTPYIYPLRIFGRDCRSIMIALNKIGVPAQPWSDLSPEVKGSKVYPLSNALRKEIMGLPVHQDLTPNLIDWMTREVIREISRHVRKR